MEREEFTVALVNPNTYQCYPAEHKPEHLGLGYLASYLRRANYPVHIIDADALDLSKEQILSELTRLHPSLLGITSYSCSVSEALDIAQEAARTISECKIVMGGHHATFAADEILMSREGVDYVVIGEGEQTLLELADALRAGMPLEDVAGIALRVGEQVKKTGPRRLIPDLDAIPLPARDTYERSLSISEPCALIVSSSRGCLSSCRFCTIQSFYSRSVGPKWRSRSPRSVVSEIVYLGSKFGRNGFLSFAFADDNFIGPGETGVDRARSIAKALRDSSLRTLFSFSCRSSSVKDESLFRELKAAGLTTILLGIEAGSDSILRLYGKDCSIEDHETAIGILKRCGIRGAYPFMNFNPYLTLDQYMENVEFLRRHEILTEGITSRVELWEHCPLIDMVTSAGLIIPKKSHRELHGYRFVDPRVGVLSEQWSKVDQAPVFKDISFLVYYVKFIVPHSIEFLNIKGDVQRADELSGYLETIVRFLPKIEVLTYEYGILLGHAVETGGESDLETLMSEYLSNLTNIIETMDESTGISKILKAYRVLATSRQTRGRALPQQTLCGLSLSN